MADTDADTDTIFLKIRGYGHDADNPRTRVSTGIIQYMITGNALQNLYDKDSFFPLRWKKSILNVVFEK